jgi:hypothetical protein
MGRCEKEVFERCRKVAEEMNDLISPILKYYVTQQMNGSYKWERPELTNLLQKAMLKIYDAFLPLRDG